MRMMGSVNSTVRIQDEDDFSDVPAIIKGKEVEHSKVLSELLKTIPENVDFRALAGLEEGKPLNARHYTVYTVKEILRIAKELDWNICQHHNYVYVYNGRYWKKIEDEQLKRFLGESAKKMGWDESFSDYYLNRDQLIKQFKSEAYLSAPVPDGSRVLINLKNGTFEISNTGTQLKDFNADDFLTYQLPFAYDPSAEAPLFQEYLARVLPDLSLQRILSEYAGYIFIPTATLKLEKVLMLYGSGANGKSVFFDILKALVGDEYFSTYSLQSLTDSTGYYRADLADRLINYSSEISGRIETAYFKQLASGEPIEARLPHKDPIVIKDYARLIFNVNQLPHDVEHTEAFFRRFLILPFDVTIPEEERDIHLAKKIIRDELPGVFNWALAGLNRLMEQQAFTYSERAEQQLRTYRKESDSVALFLEDSGYKKSLEDYTTQKELLSVYRAYCYENGYRPTSNIKFGRRLEAIGHLREDKSIGKVVYVIKE